MMIACAAPGGRTIEGPGRGVAGGDDGTGDGSGEGAGDGAGDGMGVGAGVGCDHAAVPGVATNTTKAANAAAADHT